MILTVETRVGLKNQKGRDDAMFCTAIICDELLGLHQVSNGETMTD